MNLIELALSGDKARTQELERAVAGIVRAAIQAAREELAKQPLAKQPYPLRVMLKIQGVVIDDPS